MRPPAVDDNRLWPRFLVCYISGMAIDSYAACPGGTGKKIKFCCGDLVGDLEQLDRLVEGDQISAALDQVRRLAERHPGRACLMATRVKLELASKQFGEAAASSHAFLEACPENPLALGQAALTDAVAGRTQEAAALFDRCRQAALDAQGEGTTGVSDDIVRIAATLVQAGAQTGHVGFAQGIVDWLAEKAVVSPEELRMLGGMVGSGGVPPALRTRMPLEPIEGESPWRFEFDTALDHARQWRLERALTTFRSLKGVAGESRPLFANIGILCEMLARPVEASEAWLKVAGMPGASADDAVEATGRAMALETEANPDRSPQVRYVSDIATLDLPAGEEGVTALELLEDKLRHSPDCEAATFDRSAWVSRGAAPPRSVWRIFGATAAAASDADPPPARLLASLLVFGRQTDREPRAVLQGFAPDVREAASICGGLLGWRFDGAVEVDAMPGTSPTGWLLGAQYRLRLPAGAAAATPAGAPSAIDQAVHRQRESVWARFVDAWPDTELPELLGRTPRAALADAEGGRRVEALITEGEAMARYQVDAAAWSEIRRRLGLAAPATVVSERPLDEVPPLRWHRVAFDGVGMEQLRGVLVTSIDGGFERAALLAATALADRPEATPADRWEALGVLEERAPDSVRRLEILSTLRGIAAELKLGDGMLDVAELRVRLQRGDEADVTRLLDHLRRDHSRDQQVLQAVAEVFAEAGIDLSALAAGGAGAAVPPAAAAAAPRAAETGGVWTPGGQPQPPSGEKKVIWTPG